MLELLSGLKASFNDHIAFQERRPNVFQVLAPLYHEDGDMVDVFIDIPSSPTVPLRISDHGMTLMRLSYTMDVETPARQKVLTRILSENGIALERGRLHLDTTPESLYPCLLQFAQCVITVSNMQRFFALFGDTIPLCRSNGPQSVRSSR